MKPMMLPWLRWTLFGAVGRLCALVFAGVYWINQMRCGRELEPRRQELLAVRESLVEGVKSRGFCPQMSQMNADIDGVDKVKLVESATTAVQLIVKFRFRS